MSPLRLLLLSASASLLACGGDPAPAPQPTKATPEGAPEATAATPEPTPEATPEPTPAAPAVSTLPIAGDLCAVSGVERLPDGRLLVTDAGISDAVTVFSAEGLGSESARVRLSFLSNEGPLPETIADLAGVAARAPLLALVGSFAAAGEGCAMEQDRAKVLVGRADGELAWKQRMRLRPCDWNGAGCDGDGLLATEESCTGALFTSVLTTQGPFVCRELLAAETARAGGDCGAAFAIGGATIVENRAGNKLWVGLKAPHYKGREAILLRFEEPVEKLSTFAFDRVTYLNLPEGHQIEGLGTDGANILGVTSASDGGDGRVFRFPVSALRDAATVEPEILRPPAPPSATGVLPGGTAVDVVFAGSPDGGSCAGGPKVGTWPL